MIFHKCKLTLFEIKEEQQEQPQIEKQEAPTVTQPAMRSYLDQKVVPLMLEGLAVLTKERPEKPIEFLADYLEKHNTEGK